MNFSWLRSKNGLGGGLSILATLVLLSQNSAPSSTYPALVLGGMLLFSALTFLSAFRKEQDPARAFSVKELVLMAVLFFNPLCMKVVGFWVTAFVEIFVFSLIIETKRTRRQVLSILLFCLVCVVVSYCIFTIGLRIRCPRGILV